MQLAKLPLYGLERGDLGILTTRTRPEHGDTARRERCLRVTLHKEQSRYRISVEIATAVAGERSQSALATLKSVEECSDLVSSEPDIGIVEFLHEVPWLVVDQFGTCPAGTTILCGDWLRECPRELADVGWRLNDFRTDINRQSSYCPRFPQVLISVVGLKRRVQSIAHAVMAI